MMDIKVLIVLTIVQMPYVNMSIVKHTRKTAYTTMLRVIKYSVVGNKTVYVHEYVYSKEEIRQSWRNNSL